MTVFVACVCVCVCVCVWPKKIGKKINCEKVKPCVLLGSGKVKIGHSLVIYGMCSS